MPSKCKKIKAAAQARFIRENPDYKKRVVSKLPDCYVRELLSQRGAVKTKAWPKWLIDLKRASIQLKRKHGLTKSNRGRTQ